MNVASMELCEGLLQLSGWLGCDYEWAWPSARTATRPNSLRKIDEPYVKKARNHDKVPPHAIWLPAFVAPAYDLGYLLQKLPAQYMGAWLELWKPNVGWAIGYDDGGVEENEYPTATADTPEDAAAKLAIELFKQGILKK